MLLPLQHRLGFLRMVMNNEGEKRSRIYTLIQEGYNSREIANRENVDHATVLRIKKRKEETGSFDVAPRPGRPRILTERHERNIAKLVKSGECSNAIQIQKKLATDENTLISPNTIRRALRRQGLVARVKKKNPY